MSQLNNKNITNTNSVSSGVDNTFVSTESLTVSGTSVLSNVNIGGNCNISQILNVNDTTDSSSPTTGSTIIDGGAGIAKKLFVGDNINSTGTGIFNETQITSKDGSSATNFNIIIGDSNSGAALTSTAVNNIAVGIDALKTNIVGIQNTAIGKNSLEATTGNSSTAVGSGSLLLSTGNNNTAVGKNAGDSITSGANCLFLGGDADTSLITGNNQIAIGQGSMCDLTNQCTIGNGDLVIIRPGADDTCDLGESDQAFKDLYLSGDATISGNLTLSAKCIGTAQTGDSSVVDYTNWGSVTSVGSVANWLTIGSSTTFTITVAGDYIITADCLWADASNGSERDCGFYLYLNSDVSASASSRVNYVANADGATARATASFTFLNNSVSANDTFKFKLQSLNGGTNDIVDTRLTIWKV